MLNHQMGKYCLGVLKEEKQRIETNKRVAKHRAKKKLEEEKKNSGYEGEEPYMEENEGNNNADSNDIGNEALEENVSGNNIVTPCNVTVTDKIESEKKNEKENKIKSENKSFGIDISNSCRELMRHYENITGRCNGVDYGKLHLAVNIHGESNVKNAIEKAIAAGKPDFNYINGILKNWKKEGYPKEGGDKGEGKFNRDI